MNNVEVADISASISSADADNISKQHGNTNLKNTTQQHEPCNSSNGTKSLDTKDKNQGLPSKPSLRPILPKNSYAIVAKLQSFVANSFPPVSTVISASPEQLTLVPDKNVASNPVRMMQHQIHCLPASFSQLQQPVSKVQKSPELLPLPPRTFPPITVNRPAMVTIVQNIGHGQTNVMHPSNAQTAGLVVTSVSKQVQSKPIFGNQTVDLVDRKGNKEASAPDFIRDNVINENVKTKSDNHEINVADTEPQIKTFESDKLPVTVSTAESLSGTSNSDESHSHLGIGNVCSNLGVACSSAPLSNSATKSLLADNVSTITASTTSEQNIVEAENSVSEAKTDAMELIERAKSYRFVSGNSQTPLYVSQDIVLSGGMAQQNRRRIIHNQVEKRRKEKINGWIGKIGELLFKYCPEKQSKNVILEKTYDFIQDKQSEAEMKSRSCPCGNKTNDKNNLPELVAKLAELENLVKVLLQTITKHKIPVPSSVKQSNCAFIRHLDLTYEDTTLPSTVSVHSLPLGPKHGKMHSFDSSVSAVPGVLPDGLSCEESLPFISSVMYTNPAAQPNSNQETDSAELSSNVSDVVVAVSLQPPSESIPALFANQRTEANCRRSTAEAAISSIDPGTNSISEVISESSFHEHKEITKSADIATTGELSTQKLLDGCYGKASLLSSIAHRGRSETSDFNVLARGTDSNSISIDNILSSCSPHLTSHSVNKNVVQPEDVTHTSSSSPNQTDFVISSTYSTQAISVGSAMSVPRHSVSSVKTSAPLKPISSIYFVKEIMQPQSSAPAVTSAALLPSEEHSSQSNSNVLSPVAASSGVTSYAKADELVSPISGSVSERRQKHSTKDVLCKGLGKRTRNEPWKSQVSTVKTVPYFESSSPCTDGLLPFPSSDSSTSAILPAPNVVVCATQPTSSNLKIREVTIEQVLDSSSSVSAHLQPVGSGKEDVLVVSNPIDKLKSSSDKTTNVSVAPVLVSPLTLTPDQLLSHSHQHVGGPVSGHPSPTYPVTTVRTSTFPVTVYKTLPFQRSVQQSVDTVVVGGKANSAKVQVDAKTSAYTEVTWCSHNVSSQQLYSVTNLLGRPTNPPNPADTMQPHKALQTARSEPRASACHTKTTVVNTTSSIINTSNERALSISSIQNLTCENVQSGKMEIGKVNAAKPDMSFGTSVTNSNNDSDKSVLPKARVVRHARSSGLNSCARIEQTPLMSQTNVKEAVSADSNKSKKLPKRKGRESSFTIHGNGILMTSFQLQSKKSRSNNASENRAVCKSSATANLMNDQSAGSESSKAVKEEKGSHLSTNLVKSLMRPERRGKSKKSTVVPVSNIAASNHSVVAATSDTKRDVSETRGKVANDVGRSAVREKKRISQGYVSDEHTPNKLKKLKYTPALPPFNSKSVAKSSGGEFRKDVERSASYAVNNIPSNQQYLVDVSQANTTGQRFVPTSFPKPHKVMSLAGQNQRKSDATVQNALHSQNFSTEAILRNSNPNSSDINLQPCPPVHAPGINPCGNSGSPTRSDFLGGQLHTSANQDNAFPTILNIFAPVSLNNMLNLNSNVSMSNSTEVALPSSLPTVQSTYSNFSAESLIGGLENQTFNHQFAANQQITDANQSILMQPVNQSLFTDFSTDTLLNASDTTLSYGIDNIMSRQEHGATASCVSPNWLQTGAFVTENSPIKSIMSILESNAQVSSGLSNTQGQLNNIPPFAGYPVGGLSLAHGGQNSAPIGHIKSYTIDPNTGRAEEVPSASHNAVVFPSQSTPMWCWGANSVTSASSATNMYNATIREKSRPGLGAISSQPNKPGPSYGNYLLVNSVT